MSDLVDVSVPVPVPVPEPAIEPASDPVPETTTESTEQSAELAMVSGEVARCWNVARLTDHQSPAYQLTHSSCIKSEHTYKYKVKMTCGGCSGAVSKVLERAKKDGKFTHSFALASKKSPSPYLCYD